MMPMQYSTPVAHLHKINLETVKFSESSGNWNTLSGQSNGGCLAPRDLFWAWPAE